MYYSSSAINAILIQEDMEGLIASGAPRDEYASEAAQIAEAINRLAASQITQENILAVLTVVWIRNYNLPPHEMALRLSAMKKVAALIISPF